MTNEQSSSGRISRKNLNGLLTGTKELSHSSHLGLNSGSSTESERHSNSYHPAPAGKPRKARQKRGRPKKHWTKRSVYQRKFNPKRLRATEVDKLNKADTFASRTGRRLTTFVTVRWSFTAESEANIQKRWGRLLNNCRMWCKRRGIDPAFVWTHENPPRGDPAFNSHLLINVPSGLREEFKGRLTLWSGGADGAIDVKPRTEKLHIGADRIGYMCKGTDWATAREYRLITRKGWDYKQGVVPFKRCGVSNNINRNARDTYDKCEEPCPPL